MIRIKVGRKEKLSIGPNIATLGAAQKGVSWLTQKVSRTAWLYSSEDVWHGYGLQMW
jgi:hypothetical protein